MTYKFRCSHVSWYTKGPVAKHLDHPCSDCAKCLQNKYSYSPTNCPACKEHLQDSLSSRSSTSSTGNRQFLKWQSTMTNKWKNAAVPQYSARGSQGFVWDTEELRQSWNPPTKSSQDSHSRQLPTAEPAPRPPSPTPSSVVSHVPPSSTPVSYTPPPPSQLVTGVTQAQIRVPAPEVITVVNTLPVTSSVAPALVFSQEMFSMRVFMKCFQ